MGSGLGWVAERAARAYPRGGTTEGAQDETSGALRRAFPVLAHVAYLNAGTDGPVPSAAAVAAAERTQRELERGRSGPEHTDSLQEMAARLRAAVMRLLGCGAGEVALTGSTTDGVNTVVQGLELAPGDEVLTTDEEHPGLLAPLAVARRRRGVEIRVAPFERLAEGVGPRTRLIAASHVSWLTGRVLDTEALRATGVPLLLDGAQALGAVPVDVGALGCDFYAASGQKWLCGPDGTGYLYVRSERVEALQPPWPSYVSLDDPGRPADLVLHAGARRFDTGVIAGPATAWALAAIEVLEGAGWDWVLSRGPALADRLAGLIAQRGIAVAPRGRSTLVSWEAGDTAATVERLAGEGFVVRGLPGRPLVRASVGAWSSDEEIERLAAAL